MLCVAGVVPLSCVCFVVQPVVRQSCAQSLTVSVNGKFVSASKQKRPLEYWGADHASQYSVVRGMFSRRSTHKIRLEYRLSSSELNFLMSGYAPVSQS